MVTLPSGSSGRPEGTLRSEPRLGGAPHGPLSMSFVPNRGQSDARVRYQGQIGGANVWFTRHEAVLGLSAEGGRTALGLRFVGSDPHATVTGRHPRPGTVNYLIGSDPSEWHTGLPTYGRGGLPQPVAGHESGVSR